jgi:hypothetical protein
MIRYFFEKWHLRKCIFLAQLIYLSIFILNISATNASLIAWQKNYVLSTKDFKGKIDKNSSFNANTNTVIKFKMSEEDTIKTIITAYFDKQKSWIKPLTPDKVIEHERLHFDLTEIYAREIKKRIIYTIKNENTDKKKVSLVMDYVHQLGGIQYAEKVMQDFKNEALEILFSFPQSESRDAMEELVNFTINRKK